MSFMKTRAMKTNLVLPQKYIDLGFKLHKVGEKSVALKYQDNLVFVFVSGIEAREDFVNRLCDCHLNLTILKDQISQN